MTCLLGIYFIEKNMILTRGFDLRAKLSAQHKVLQSSEHETLTHNPHKKREKGSEYQITGFDDTLK